MTSLPKSQSVEHANITDKGNRMNQKKDTIYHHHQHQYKVERRDDIPGESPESINEAIQEVLLLIEAMDPTTNTACKLAQKQDPHLLTNNRFLLRFLRAAMYDTGDCAKRVVAYFEQKKQLFGAKRLCKPVTIADLDEADRKCLRSSIMQLLPGRDRAGRAILLWNACLQSGHSRLSQQRVQFYGLQVGSEPLEVQHCGLIVVFWNHGPGRLPVSELEGIFQEVSESLIGVPQIRCEGFHCCIDLEDDDVRISSALMRLASNFSRVNVRCHSGSVAEIRSSLKTFGVPVHLLPLLEREDESSYRYHVQLYGGRGREISLDRQRDDTSLKIAPVYSIADKVAPSKTTRKFDKVTSDMLRNVILPPRKRLKTEDRPKPHPSVEMAQPAHACYMELSLGHKDPRSKLLLPTDKDIVMGKGRRIQNLPGNVKFRDIIGSYFDQYESADSVQDKTLLAMRIVADIQESGGKFLKEDPHCPGRYTEADFQVAREKVSSTFHSHRRWNKQKSSSISSAELKSSSPPPMQKSDKDKRVSDQGINPHSRTKINNAISRYRDLSVSTSGRTVHSPQILPLPTQPPSRFTTKTPSSRIASYPAMAASERIETQGRLTVLPLLSTRNSDNSRVNLYRRTNAPSLSGYRYEYSYCFSNPTGRLHGQHLHPNSTGTSTPAFPLTQYHGNSFSRREPSVDILNKACKEGSTQEVLQAQLYREMGFPGF